MAVHKFKDQPDTFLGMPTNWQLECDFEAWNGTAATGYWGQVTCKDCLKEKPTPSVPENKGGSE